MYHTCEEIILQKVIKEILKKKKLLQHEVMLLLTYKVLCANSSLI